MLLGGNSLVAAFFTYCLGREVRRHTIAEYDMDGDGRLSWAEWEVMVLVRRGAWGWGMGDGGWRSAWGEVGWVRACLWGRLAA